MIKFFSKHLNNKKGFTLIELIVVIVILGILAAIVVPRIGRFRTRAANAAHNANVRTLWGAATTFLAEEGIDAGIDWDGGVGEDSNESWKEYINSWPKVPKGAQIDGVENDGVKEGENYKVKTVEGEIKVYPGLIDLDEGGGTTP